MNRVDSTPVYQQRTDQIEANLYNLWRRVRSRYKLPIRIEPQDNPGIAIILEDGIWLCVNARANDMPILAWLDFKDHEQDALFSPVACTINYYHFAATRYRHYTLQAMHPALENLLTGEGKN